MSKIYRISDFYMKSSYYEKLYMLLVVINNVFKKFNIQYWAECGTLIGAMRHRGIIPWDDDADVNIPHSDYKRLLKDKQILNEFKKYKCNMKEMSHIKLIKVFPKDVEKVGLEYFPSVDVFSVSLNENEEVEYTYSWAKKDWPKYKIPISWIFPLKYVKFGRDEILVPKFPEKVLDKTIGKDWMIGKIYQSHVLGVELEDPIVVPKPYVPAKNFYEGKIRLDRYEMWHGCVTYPKPDITPKQLLPIPKVIHQIWIGKEKPLVAIKLTETIIKVLKDYIHVQWGNETITRDNFPFTYDVIQKCLYYMRKYKVNKYAQIADLMRYEILYWHGGVYMDAYFEARKDITKLLHPPCTLANEDPVGLNEEYISNAFIASIPQGTIMERCLKNVDKIDMDILPNESSGPFYLRKNIRKTDVVYIINTKYIYPFIDWDSDYRKRSKNKCINSKQGVRIDDKRYLDIPCDKYKDAYVIYHSLGGTWH